MNKQFKKAGIAHPPAHVMVSYCVAAFADYLAADATLQNAKALWDAARMGLRTELDRAHKAIGTGKPWDGFKAQVRAALVKAKVCGTPKDAGRLVDNQLIALGLTGQGTRKGGKRKGAGRPERTDTGGAISVSEKATASRLVAILAYVADAHAKHAGDEEIIELLGDIARLANGEK